MRNDLICNVQVSYIPLMCEGLNSLTAIDKYLEK